MFYKKYQFFIRKIVEKKVFKKVRVFKKKFRILTCVAAN